MRRADPALERGDENGMKLNHMRDSTTKPWRGPEPSIADGIILVIVILILLLTL